MKKFLIIMLLASGGYIFATPYLTIAEIKKSVESGDTTTLLSKIDFDSVRSNAKSRVEEKLKNTTHLTGDERVDAYMRDFSSKAANGLIDAVIKPENLKALAEAYHQQKTKNEEYKKSNPSDSQGSNTEVKNLKKFENFKLDPHYKDLNHFEIFVQPDDYKGPNKFTIVMSRKTLFNWQITDVDLGE